jgi:RimJ/RimL family protein N-acetyltransferase
MSRTVIADEVIQLRPLSPEDAETHLLGCDSAVIDSLGGGQPPSREQVLLWLTQNAAGWANDMPVVDLGIEDRATGALCGTVGIQRGLDYLEQGQVNLTYALYPNWRGHGYATRAVRLAMEVARRGAPVREFVIRAAAWNEASIRVAQRLGFRLSQTTDDENGQLEWFTDTTSARRLQPGSAGQPSTRPDSYG